MPATVAAARWSDDSRHRNRREESHRARTGASSTRSGQCRNLWLGPALL